MEKLISAATGVKYSVGSVIRLSENGKSSKLYIVHHAVTTKCAFSVVPMATVSGIALIVKVQLNRLIQISIKALRKALKKLKPSLKL